MRQVFRNCSQWQSVLVRSNTTVNTGKVKEMFTAEFQFPVLFGLPMVVLSTEGGVWAGETMAAKELGALWQWTQCMQMAQWPRRRDSVALSLSAGPNFMPKVVVRWSSVRSGNEEPSMRCSRKFCNRRKVTLLSALPLSPTLLSIKWFKSWKKHTHIIFSELHEKLWCLHWFFGYQWYCFDCNDYNVNEMGTRSWKLSR